MTCALALWTLRAAEHKIATSLAYVASFATIGAAWLGHNAITEYLERADAAFVRLLTERLTPGLAGYLVLIISGLFLPVLAVIGYLAIALYDIIPSRGLSADFFPRHLRKKAR